jgi:hypothetical protein
MLFQARNFLESVGMGVCLGYTVICWTNAFGALNNMHPGVSLAILFPAGMVCTLIGFGCALWAWRRRRRLALLTLVACLLWTVWSALPRL